MGIEDLMRQIEEDERQDALELAEFMGISEYAKAKGLRPQLVHYHIRAGNIKKHDCPCCGRKVIKIVDANAVFEGRKETTRAGVRVELMDGEDGSREGLAVLEGREDLVRDSEDVPRGSAEEP